MRGWRAGVAGGLVVLATTRPVGAQLDLDARQSDDWYALHLSLFGLGVGGTLGAKIAGEPLASRFHEAFWFESGTARNFSLLSARISDVTLSLAVASPAAFLGVEASAQRFENSLLIYGEALSLQIWLNSATKLLMARGRPYSGSPQEPQRAFTEERSSDRVLSFYSGHSAISFTAAFTGGFLFSDGNAAQEWQALFWAWETSLAAFTAHARVRAGMHYPSDVVFGALVGTIFGLGIPLLHGVRPEISPAEWGALGGGLVLGAAGAWLLPAQLGQTVLAYEPRLDFVPGGAVLRVGSEF